MTRLLVHVEGQTEETFVNEVLAPYLSGCGFESVSARIVGNARLRQSRGGIKPWPAVRRDIMNHLKQDSDCYATTMVDYYALPKSDPEGWPGRAEAAQLLFPHKAQHIERKLHLDVQKSMDPNFNSSRFIPFIMMHEFEALLFSNCEAFSRGIGRSDLEIKFQEIRNQFNTPEEINDSPITAPSKRVEALVPEYEKPLQGTLAILEIGLPALRAECPHFGSWLDRLIQIGKSAKSRALP